MTTTTKIDQIRTRYQGPRETPSGNVRGSRITAVVQTGAYKGRRLTSNYDHALVDNHTPAARALVDRLGITGTATYVGTNNDGGSTYDIIETETS